MGDSVEINNSPASCMSFSELTIERVILHTTIGEGQTLA